MDFKPTIFIGSSKEGFAIAERVATLLKDFANCKLWKEAFHLGDSSYDNLISQIALYDYGIFIATADDVVLSRKKYFDSPRDNVLFEFGLFAGGLGKMRTFYLVEEGTKIPSDLSGITLPVISKKTDPSFGQTIADCAFKIKKHILDSGNTFDLGFLPSTALAYGYFSNFIERTVERLLDDRSNRKIFHLENGTQFKIKTLKVTILIPDDLSSDMFKKVKAKRLKDGWQKLRVDPKDIRDYNFSIDVSKVDKGLLHLVDIPFTLNALNLAIELYSRKAHLGKSEKELLLEKREIRNFKNTLEHLVKASSFTRDIVSIEIVNV
jgi:hypothetical protein